MAERKVISKYYPPDFDPSKVAKAPRHLKKSGATTITVRLEMPFKTKCNACGEYIAEGRRFNARKQITDEKYLSIKIYRFYIHCPSCHNQIAFITDPKNSHYRCDFGARSFREPKTADEHLGTYEERHGRPEQEETSHDRLQEPERKALDERSNMAIADALDEIRARNATRDHKQQEASLDLKRTLDEQDIEDSKLARQAFARKCELGHEVDMEDTGNSNGVCKWNIGVRKKQNLRGNLLRRQVLKEG